MSAQTTPITERQLDLITRAHCDAGGLIEPLLELKGGAKLKMIASLAQRGLIEQMDGQWRITRAAIAIIKGEAQPEDVLPAVKGAATSPTPPLADDPELEAAVAAAEASWQQVQPASTLESPKRSPGNSKQALVIEMLKRPEGATIAQICEATGWQAHTVRGTFAGALKKKLGLNIVSEKIVGPAGTPGAGQRLYRIAEEATA
ncbi:DUF3489 domain-containing protein [Diaphorobacter sp. JS3050]|uniref:DUF3489 domain-containing protein n=1 Tax=Diaphorobacter sp. JS3050 TaxID=2735554 RepID=UPI0015565D35|nr:DUF3489 domain-containing protein [Diaphorobacter sp. JS3050]QJY32125.1 DUF3489 domain-containing protein [Diaphorobacter sp. JS3050]